ncbi:PREDICTED: (-)-germacrene D synthase-like [Nelumbo nucifera]|uniref:(-)-germacrene D synthase-like n=1 Tax=Nelumbo nucifera TaxID=4432 RepID=A0A1U7ZVH8_NELNU|nr:PREDICTED: (-)-germacrene D synthase-like [Nelumbo nucifera]
MLHQASSCPPILCLPEIEKPKVVRRSANFHPSIWGDRFTTYTCDNMTLDACNKQAEGLKEEVRCMLMNSTNGPSEILSLIDTIQRLGLAYHFEREIDEILEHMLVTHVGYFNGVDDDLHTIALWFRLLRQNGYNIPCDIFNKFKDDHGKFRDGLTRDLKGILGLYEAAHLGIRGEEVLDEALAFTTAQLESSVVTNTSSHLVKQVMHALEQPFHRGMLKLEARHYISFYEQDETHNPVLLQFAKLDFNRLQPLHLKELSQISKWWKDLDFALKIPYARNRVVECYFWIMGVYPEPQYSLGRMILTKVIAMTSVLDDTYDIYGTLEELQLFTDAIERWDVGETDQLLEYMKVIYLALLDVYNEIEEQVNREGRSYCVYYAKEAMRKQARAYLVEAKWFFQGHIPIVEEYMDVALISTSYPLLAVASFVGMGEIATKEAFDWVSNLPNLVKNSSIICRLMDDIMTHEYEQEKGDVCSSVECYMKQYGVSKQEVVEEFSRSITNAWKDINEECLRTTAIPKPLLTRVANLARMMDVIYKHGNGYTNAETVLKDHITSLLIDSIKI